MNNGFNSKMRSLIRKPSHFSSHYIRCPSVILSSNSNNKGYLDENEQKMREMDTSNRGFLTNDKVYSMLEEQIKLQKTLVTQRKLIIGLCVFAVVLALANMGTAVSESMYEMLHAVLKL